MSSQIQFTPAQIQQLNVELADKTPQEIIEWAIDNVQGLFQTTAFGLTGCAALDMISKISQARNTIHLVPLVSFMFCLDVDCPGYSGSLNQVTLIDTFLCCLSFTFLPLVSSPPCRSSWIPSTTSKRLSSSPRRVKRPISWTSTFTDLRE